MTPSTTPPLLARTREDWRAWLHHDLAHGLTCLQRDGKLIPLFVLHRETGDKVILSAPFVDPRQKAAVLNFVALACVAHQVRALSVIGEAWMTTPDAVPGESETAALARANAGLLPSQAEHKREALMVALTYRDDTGRTRGLSVIAEIKRDAGGAVSGLGEAIEGDDDEALGTMFNLLDEHPPHAGQVVAAQFVLAQEGASMMRQLGILD